MVDTLESLRYLFDLAQAESQENRETRVHLVLRHANNKNDSKHVTNLLFAIHTLLLFLENCILWIGS